MCWYTKYLQWYDRSFTDISSEIIDVIRKKIGRLNSDSPLVSVVIIAHNEEKHLISCIWSLLDNLFDFPIELIAVNNNSTDHTEELLRKLGVTYYNEEKKGPGYARQCGLNHARGKYYLCIDADTIYPPYYITTHIKELLKPGIICSYSLWSFIPDASHSKAGLLAYEFLRDLFLYLQAIKRPELSVRGMAMGFNTEFARKIGFRTDIIRGEDGYLAFQLRQYGKIIFIHSRRARVVTGYGTLEKDGSFFRSFRLRFYKHFKHLFSLFTRKMNYEDNESNILDKS